VKLTIQIFSLIAYLQKCLEHTLQYLLRDGIIIGLRAGPASAKVGEESQ